MRKLLACRLVEIAVSIAVLMGIALPAQALRCGTKLVNEGDLTIQVRDKCGDPVSEELIGYTLRPGFSGADRNVAYEREYKIEQWVYGVEMGYYNVMTFEGGRLKRIERIKE
jgi:hypothetical protein